MKRSLFFFKIICLSAVLLTGCSSLSFSRSNGLVPGNTYVVLIEKNYYPSGYSDLDFNYTNSYQLMEFFEALGVPYENILFVKDQIGEKEIQ